LTSANAVREARPRHAGSDGSGAPYHEESSYHGFRLISVRIAPVSMSETRDKKQNS
jgi:hypothetical protein